MGNRFGYGTREVRVASSFGIPIRAGWLHAPHAQKLFQKALRAILITWESTGFYIIAGDAAVLERDDPPGPLHDHLIMSGEDKGHAGFFIQLFHHIQ